MTSGLGWNHGTPLLAVCLVLVTMVTRSTGTYDVYKRASWVSPYFSCSSGYNYMGGFCFSLITEEMTRSEAIATCKARGGLLAEPTSEVEKIQLKRFLFTKNMNKYMHFGGEENETLPCEIKKQYVCERECSCTQAEGCPLEWDSVVGGFCYKLVRQQKTHDVAQTECKAMGGMLAEPRTKDDYLRLKHYLFVTKRFGFRSGHVHVGGKYVTGGKAASYKNWAYESDDTAVPEDLLDWEHYDPWEVNNLDTVCSMLKNNAKWEHNKWKVREEERVRWTVTCDNFPTYYVCQKLNAEPCKIVVKWRGRAVQETHFKARMCNSFKVNYVCERKDDQCKAGTNDSCIAHTVTQVTREEYCKHSKATEKCTAQCKMCIWFCQGVHGSEYTHNKSVQVHCSSPHAMFLVTALVACFFY